MLILTNKGNKMRNLVLAIMCLVFMVSCLVNPTSNTVPQPTEATPVETAVQPAVEDQVSVDEATVTSGESSIVVENVVEETTAENLQESPSH